LRRIAQSLQRLGEEPEKTCSLESDPKLSRQNRALRRATLRSVGFSSCLVWLHSAPSSYKPECARCIQGRRFVPARHCPRSARSRATSDRADIPRSERASPLRSLFFSSADLRSASVAKSASTIPEFQKLQPFARARLRFAWCRA